jgi:hypothetical protein
VRDPSPAPGAARPGSPETPDGKEVTVANRTPRHYAPFRRHAVSTDPRTGKTYYAYTRLTFDDGRSYPAFPKAFAVRHYQYLLLTGDATDLRPVPPDRPLFDQLTLQS